MLNDRLKAGQDVASCLFALEEALDEVVVRAAKLTAAIPEARRTAKLSALYGQAALDCSSQAVASVVHARQRVVEAHKLLDEDRVAIGLGDFNFGDGNAKPKPTGFADEGLRAVA